MYVDTIAAIATAPGEGGIGIVRLSGPEAAPIAGAIFRSGRRGRSLPAFESHRLYYGYIIDPASADIVDEVLCVQMAGPRSYTREDVVEISCHGGRVAVEDVLRVCLAQGARLAEPGEFTLRAFMNGRIDLSQAEAVADIVSARTSRSRELAVDELRGRLAARLRPARDRLVETLAFLDAAADFPDDEIPDLDLEQALQECKATLDAVTAASTRGLLYREGVQVAIVGRPNAGKSSLLNSLLRADRAIVTDVAGTTRDVISERISLGGIPATLLDTAGIAESSDVIEQMGIARSREALVMSGIALFVVDGSQPLTDADRHVAMLLNDRLDDGTVLVARNKADLPQQLDGAELAALLPGVDVVEISTRTGTGLELLEQRLEQLVGVGVTDDAALVTVRQHDALQRANAAVAAAIQGLEDGFPRDLTAIDVREALYALGEISGESVDEAVLDEIFSRFCIGK